MPEGTSIHVPRENVNDDSVRLVSWLVADRQRVSPGQPIAEIETSKATAEIVSPAEGTLSQVRKAGEEIEVGGLLGYVGDADAVDEPMHGLDASSPGLHEAPPSVPADLGKVPAEVGAQTSALVHPLAEHVVIPATAPVAATQSPAVPEVYRGSRIGPRAMELIRQHGIDPSIFANRGLIRTEDVQRYMNESKAGSSPAVADRVRASSPQGNEMASAAGSNGGGSSQTIVGEGGVAVRKEPLSRSKRVEARYLWPGLHDALPSVITVACPTRGLRAACRTHPALDGQTTPLIVFEAARLLRKYPALNAYHADGSIHYYQSVNVGIAVDADRGLKVPVIRDADVKSLEEISRTLRLSVVQYLEDELPVESLSGGTFTVTDLSGDGVFAFHPLINRAQSSILGVGGEFFAPGSREGLFNLILAFDHQLAEGRQAARFLNELKKRLASYEQALSGHASAELSDEGLSDSGACCWRCMADAGELAELGHYLLRSVGTQGEPLLVCSRCVLGHG